MPLNRTNPDEAPRKKISGGLAAYVQAERLMQIALLLPASVFIGWLGGVWLDHLLHQTWIAVIGILFGGIAGLVYAAQMAMAAAKSSSGEDAPGQDLPGAGDSQPPSGSNLKDSFKNGPRDDDGQGSAGGRA